MINLYSPLVLSDEARTKLKAMASPIHAYRQTGVGGALRVLPDPSTVVSHDFFGRDRNNAARKTVDRLNGVLASVGQVEVGLYEASFNASAIVSCCL